MGAPSAITVAGSTTAGSLFFSSSAAVSFNVPGNILYSTGTLAVGTASTGVGTLGFLNSESSLSTLTVNNQAGNTAITLGSTTAISSTAILALNTGNSGADQIATLGKMTVDAGEVKINLTALPGTTLAAGGYPLITFGICSDLYRLGHARHVFGHQRPDLLLDRKRRSGELHRCRAERRLRLGAGRLLDRLAKLCLEHVILRRDHQLRDDRERFDRAGVPSTDSNVFFTANGAINLTQHARAGLHDQQLDLHGYGHVRDRRRDDRRDLTP